MKAERKADDEQRRAHLDLVERVLQVRRREGAQQHAGGQCRAVDLDHGHIDFARRVFALAPDALAVAVEQHRQAGGLGQVGGRGVQFDLQPIGKVLARLIEHDMPARDHEQAFVAGEKETGGPRQQAVPVIGGDLRDGQQQRFSHWVGVPR